MSGPQHDRLAGLEGELAARGIDLIALAFVDNAGITRAKCVPRERAVATAVRGVGSPHAFSVFTGADGMATQTGTEATGDLRIRPDYDALAGGVDGWGWAPADLVTQEGDPWQFCTRTFLRRMVARAADAGYELRMAYELEWHAEHVDGGAPLHDGPAYSLAATADVAAYLRDVTCRLTSHGIGVEQVHAEYSPGQLELSVSARDPVTAADETVLARHVIRSARAATGVRASFAPLAGEGLLGNGAHLHVSLWRDGENLLGAGGGDAHGMTPEGRAFLAGVVRELPALVALGSASPLSFRRRAPGRWTGAFTCWGVENREAPVRLIRGTAVTRPGSANVELKALDATGNPYLVAGAVIAAGLRGVEEGAEPPEPVSGEPSRLDAGERERCGIAPLPGGLEESADALAASADLRASLGDELHAAIVAVRRAEAEFARSLSDDGQLAYYRWRY